MYPILISLGNFSIRSYGAMAAIGFVVACFLVNWNRKYAKMSSDQASTSLFVAMIAGIIGARIFYVVQFFDHYRGNLWSMFRIDQGGLVFYGGFLFAMAALWLYCRWHKLDLVRVFDVYAPALAVAHGLGRVGCFLNGCCWGKPTDSWIGVAYPAGSDPEVCFPGAHLHPVQLYEAMALFALFFLYVYLVRHTKRGVTMASYLLIYGVIRFFNELLRGDNQKVWADFFTLAQVIGLLIIPAGIALLIYFLRRNEPKNSELSN